MRVFFKFDGGFHFFEIVKKTEQIQVPVFLRNYGGPKKYRFPFLTVFDKNTGHRVTKIGPEYLISDIYKSYFIIFLVTCKKNLLFFIYATFEIDDQRRVAWSSGRAVDSESAIPGSRPAADNFFSVFFCLPHLRSFFFLPKNSAFAEDGGFFAKKNLRISLNIYYINCRYDRRFTYRKDLRPPHFWQTNSNYGSLSLSPPFPSARRLCMYDCTYRNRSVVLFSVKGSYM